MVGDKHHLKWKMGSLGGLNFNLVESDAVSG